MTHEEEEVQHDISKLQDQVQQLSLLQKVTKNEMEAKMDSLNKFMEAKINNMEAKINSM